jgi:zinc transport system substrate-binding protein
MKNLKVIFIVLFLALAVLFFFISVNDKKPKSQKPMVSVTTFALYDIVQHIANDSLEITHILPFGVDPHSFEPTPKLMTKIENSSLVFYSGAGLEPWTEGFKFKSKAVNVSKYVNLRALGIHKDEEHEEHEHHHGAFDPHYWLDFSNMQKATNIITEELIKLLPENKTMYTQNRDKYVKMLQQLDTAYKAKLSSCKVNTVVMSHNALGYLSDRYGFNVASLTGLSPEAQPSAKDVTRIMQDIKKDGVTTIFFENFVNDKVIKRIAKDTHINIDVFQPLGNITKDEADAGLTYEEIMYKNLDKLSKALVCH